MGACLLDLLDLFIPLLLLNCFHLKLHTSSTCVWTRRTGCISHQVTHRSEYHSQAPPLKGATRLEDLSPELRSTIVTWIDGPSSHVGSFLQTCKWANELKSNASLCAGNEKWVVWTFWCERSPRAYTAENFSMKYSWAESDLLDHYLDAIKSKHLLSFLLSVLFNPACRIPCQAANQRGNQAGIQVCVQSKCRLHGDTSVVSCRERHL